MAVLTEVVLNVCRVQLAGIRRSVTEMAQQELTRIPQAVDAGVLGQAAVPLEKALVLGQDRGVRIGPTQHASRLPLGDHPQQRIPRCPACDETPRVARKSLADRQML